uniref:NAD(P)H-quinone oxidoreductase subunit 6, chloroplastic n=3 Tax=Isoetes TaxID=13838 RepID=A0A343URJ5_9TRAC|nr:NADH dehydrogenase subunit 6 [Isoetes cangae]YP_009515303.1 NADH dehydrogenase subunit 6 [Isoetes serracarajensis]QUS64712.1 NdhG [Isoetes anamariae]QUS64794.1 NdhG [Isoetes longifolia]QUS64876.1 NdhG [Isoetes luetzelburgii]QUS64958.1 NdhG [Isoetes cipoensis]QUS65040.1 NdhG [Isoetes harleyi]QUS65122.1 NdhG [Isoetes amazonica]QUS65204.1 NdhG [Isoetes gardneriana]QUS65286.1 NdhG [Isoetes panamensis]QUS65368.1 NdhG [Isoetes triangula]
MINLPEPIHEAIFVSLELGPILGGPGVVSLTNIVYSAPLSGSVFACISLPYLLPNADFVAAVQISIYVGAVNVSIVSAVTSTNEPQSFHLSTYRTAGDGITLALCISLFFLPIIMILDTSWSRVSLIVLPGGIVEEPLTDDVQRIGSHLLTDSLLPFEPLSIVLLVALVGAITTARRDKMVKLEESEVLQAKDDFFVS